MHPLRSFFTYITNGILSLRKNFHTLRIFKLEEFADLSVVKNDGDIFLKIKPNLTVDDKIHANHLKINLTSFINEIRSNYIDIINHQNETVFKVERDGYVNSFGVKCRDEIRIPDPDGNDPGFYVLNNGVVNAMGLSCYSGAAGAVSLVLDQLQLTMNGDIKCVAESVTGSGGKIEAETFKLINDGFVVSGDGDVTISGKLVAEDDVEFELNVIFNGNSRFYSDTIFADSVTFEGITTFEDDVVFDSNVIINGNLILNDLEESDPNESGVIWNDNGTLKISAG